MIATFLAQFPAQVSGNHILISLGIVFGFLAIWNQAATALRGGKPTRVEQPVRVETIVGVPSRQELEMRFGEMERRIEAVEEGLGSIGAKITSEMHAIVQLSEKRREEMQAALAAMDAKDEERTVQVHKRCNELSERVASCIAGISHLTASAERATQSAVEASKAAIQVAAELKTYVETTHRKRHA